MIMKKTFFALCALSMVLFSCKKDDDNVPALTSNSVATTVTTGTWGITYYFDTDHEETSNFTGYAFVFDGTGAVIAAKTGSSIPGTWSTGTDNSKVKFVLAFAAPADFAEISEDWEVLERTDTKLRLQHVSGGNGGTDLLTFERNK